MSFARILIVAACGAAFMTGAASADILHNFALKVGVSAVLPDESAKISAIGGDAKISDEYVPTLGVEYFFSNHISAELLCCAARHDVEAIGTTLGTVKLGKVSHFPPTLTVKYRWTDYGKFQPYVGAGINYTHFFDAKAPAGGPVNSIKYDDSFGGALQAGLDYKLDENWSLNVDVRKIWIKTDVLIHAGATPINASVDINPWVLTLGTGYRF